MGCIPKCPGNSPSEQPGAGAAPVSERRGKESGHVPSGASSSQLFPLEKAAELSTGKEIPHSGYCRITQIKVKGLFWERLGRPSDLPAGMGILQPQPGSGIQTNPHLCQLLPIPTRLHGLGKPSQSLPAPAPGSGGLGISRDQSSCCAGEGGGFQGPLSTEIKTARDWSSKQFPKFQTPTLQQNPEFPGFSSRSQATGILRNANIGMFWCVPTSCRFPASKAGITRQRIKSWRGRRCTNPSRWEWNYPSWKSQMLLLPQSPARAV